MRKASGVETHQRGGEGVDIEACVGGGVLSRRNHKRFSSAVRSAQSEVLEQMAGVVQRETELGLPLRLALAKHNELEILEMAFSTQLCEGSQQKIHSFTGIVACANGAEQQ